MLQLLPVGGRSRYIDEINGDGGKGLKWFFVKKINNNKNESVTWDSEHNVAAAESVKGEREGAAGDVARLHTLHPLVCLHL